LLEGGGTFDILELLQIAREYQGFNKPDAIVLGYPDFLQENIPTAPFITRFGENSPPGENASFVNHCTLQRRDDIVRLNFPKKDP